MQVGGVAIMGQQR